MNRISFAKMCDHRGYRIAAEIGTDRGCFARDLLLHSRLDLLVCVDPYVPYGEMPYERIGDLIMASNVLAPFVDRAKIVQLPSVKAAQWWPYAPPQFVYVDGEHSYVNVLLDIETWWGKLAPGGVLAGHDYHESTPGVIHAVDDFVQSHELELRLTDDFNEPRSWWVEKPV